MFKAWTEYCAPLFLSFTLFVPLATFRPLGATAQEGSVSPTTVARIEESLKRLDAQLLGKTVRIKSVTRNEAGAMVEQSSLVVKTSKDNRVRVIERERYRDSHSVPSNVWLYYRIPQYVFHAFVTKEPHNDSIFRFAEEPSYISQVPLPGTYEPRVFGNLTFSDIFAKRDSLAIDKNGHVWSVSLFTSELGEFTFDFDIDNDWLLTEFSLRLTQDHLVAPDRKLGQGSPSASAIVQELFHYSDLVVDTDPDHWRLLSWTLTYVASRSNGKHVLRKETASVEYQPWVMSEDHTKIDWESSSLEIPYGTYVQRVPTDHLRYEFHNGEIFRILDSGAAQSLRTSRFLKPSRKVFRLFFGAVIALVAIGLIRYYTTRIR